MRVVKIGGSLLDESHVFSRLWLWDTQQPSMPTLLIIGGGRLVDEIRRLSNVHNISEQSAHWLCIRAMRITAEMVSAQMHEISLVDRFEDCLEIARGSSEMARIAIFDTSHFLREVEPHKSGTRLPHNWQVTSDSISARVAECLDASELVLLKSCLPETNQLGQWVTSGFVDPFFAQAAETLPMIRAVNLRDDDFPTTTAGT